MTHATSAHGGIFSRDWTGAGQESADEARALLARMQHTLRTPLNAVIGFSEAMRRELHGPLGDPRYREYVAHISECGGRLLEASEETLAVAATMSALLADRHTVQHGRLPAGRETSYRDLCVWKEAMRLAEMCYRHTQGFPEHERSGLTARIRRVAASIPASIAEGHGREDTEHNVGLLRIAQGSCRKLETHILLASRVLDDVASGPEPVLDQTDAVGRMLRALIRSLC